MLKLSRYSKNFVSLLQIGSRNSTAFNRILNRLQRQNALQGVSLLLFNFECSNIVGDANQSRVVRTRFVTSVSSASLKFSEFQV